MTQAIIDRDFATETNEGLVSIDFWATWCGSCRIQAPVLEQLSEEYDEDEVRIVKTDVDKNPATPASFGITSTPTLLLKKDDEAAEKAVGIRTKDQL